LNEEGLQNTGSIKLSNSGALSVQRKQPQTHEIAP